MHRNLDRRVEAIVSITNPAHVGQVEELFEMAFAPTTVHWELHDSTWTAHPTDAGGTPLTDIQEWLIQQTSARRSSR